MQLVSRFSLICAPPELMYVSLAAKRRKLDKHELERQAARAAARVVFLEQLEKEGDLIEEGKHPLIERTLKQLTEEKNRRLKNLAKVLERKELEYEKRRDASTEQAWRQWAVRLHLRNFLELLR